MELSLHDRARPMQKELPMRFRSVFATFSIAAAIAGMLFAPATANAFDKDKHKKKRQSRGLKLGHYKNGVWVQEVVRSEYDRRQETKNEWRNIAIAAGAIGILGLIKNDSTLTFAGAAGALYAAHRYEEDRKSQNKLARTRAYYFSKPYFVRDGRRYERRTVWVKGKKYYRFVKC
jgi:hypothetical protein